MNPSSSFSLLPVPEPARPVRPSPPPQLSSFSKGVFSTLAKENEAYYRSLGPQNNERVDFATNFVMEKGVEGAYKVFLSNFDLNNVFTGGCRPEIKQECKMLFGCLNKDLTQPSLRARQKFVSEGHSDQVQISLFLHVIEIWCPGLIRDETLINAYIDTSKIPNKGSCSFSSLLSDAQFIVQSLRSNYRTAVERKIEDKRLAEIMAHDNYVAIRSCSPMDSIMTDPCVDRNVDCHVDIDESPQKEEIADKHSIQFDYSVPFHRDTLKSYERIQQTVDCLSSDTLHIINYIRQNCEDGCRIISDSELLIKNFFTTGKRPEIKKEAKKLFGWLTGKEIEFLHDRARQKFTHKSDADHYRYSLFLYIIELWRPFSSTVEALRDAYIPATRTAFTGIISSALQCAQQAVYEIRQDLQESGKPDASHVKITKFQKKRRRKKQPSCSYLTEDLGLTVLDELRYLFMSKVKFINDFLSSVPINSSTNYTDTNKRKISYCDENGNGGD